MIKDNLVIFKEFFKEFKSTGTICPTSKWAAEAMTENLKKPHAPLRILEIGAGTGSVTKKILKYMKPEDELIICEINSRLVSELKNNLEKNSFYKEKQSSVTFFEGPIQEIESDKEYDLIICSLPFLNFELNIVQEIFTKLLDMSHDKTLMVYYEFIGLKELGKKLSSPNRKRRLSEIDSYFKLEYFPRKIERRRIWLNFPPINIYTLKMAA